MGSFIVSLQTPSRYRKAQEDRGAGVAVRLFRPKVAAVGQGDLAGDRQGQPGALGLGCEEMK